jgi:hypothetical protein
MVALEAIVYKRENEVIVVSVICTSQKCFIVCIEVQTGGLGRWISTATSLSPVHTLSPVGMR